MGRAALGFEPETVPDEGRIDDRLSLKCLISGQWRLRTGELHRQNVHRGSQRRRAFTGQSLISLAARGSSRHPFGAGAPPARPGLARFADGTPRWHSSASVCRRHQALLSSRSTGLIQLTGNGHVWGTACIDAV
jgi:hypothetical protein